MSWLWPFTLGKTLLGAGCFVFSALVWEHIGRVNKWKRRPSFYLDHAGTAARRGFEVVGKYIAHISSFYTYLHLSEFVDSCVDLTKSVWKLTTSPFWTLVGYAKTLDLYEQVKNGNSWVVLFGTLTLLAVLGGSVSYYYGNYLPFLKHLPLLKYLPLHK